MHIDKIENLDVSENKFAGKRETTGMHQDWDKIYLIVEK